MDEAIKSPFPWPGGKSTIANEIWRRLGDTPNYCEPFAGSAAVLLARPHDLDGKTETLNDLDGLIQNVWRAITFYPDETAYWCDRPVSECDLTAAHLHLKAQRAELTSRLCADIDYCDPRLAGLWLYGVASWIGDGWCVADGPWINVEGRLVDRRTLPEGEKIEGVGKRIPSVSQSGYGNNFAGIQRERYRAAPGVPRKMPEVGKRENSHSGSGGKGVQALRQRDGVPRQMPGIGRGANSQFGDKPNGVQALRQRDGVPRQMPNVGTSLTSKAKPEGVNKNTLVPPGALLSYFDRLALRLRRVRLLCGDWRRAVKDSITVNHGLTGLLLDPPYPSAEHSMSYHGDNDIWWDVARWAVAHGDDPRLRVCVCGYVSDATDAIFPATWTRVAWQARGGYANQSKDGRGRANARREMLWFSPHCLDPANDWAGTLFEAPS